MDKNKLGVIITALSASGFGTMAIFAKIAYAFGSNSVTVLTIRFVVASLLFLAIMKILKMKWGINKKQLIYLIGLGAAGYGVLSYFFFMGVGLLPASVASLLLYSYPTMVCLLAYIIGDERMYPQKVVALLVSAAGLYLVIGPVFENLNLKGVAFVLTAAAIYATYIVISNRVLMEVHWLPSSTVVSISAALFFLIVGNITGEISYDVPIEVLLSGIGIAVFSTVLAIGGLYAGISMIGPSKTAIVSVLEPVVTVILAAIIFKEILQIEQLFGGLLIISAILIIQMSRQKVTDDIDENTIQES